MNNSDVLAKIRVHYNSLSKSQKNLANYVLNKPEEVMYKTISDFAKETSTSEPTVMRFLNKIGYSSYQVFKVQLAQNTSEKINDVLYEEINKNDTSKEVINKITKATADSIIDARFLIDEKELNIIVKTIKNARKILIIGVGSSYAIAFDLYHKLLKLDLNSDVCSDTHIMNIRASNLGEKDLLICISHSGESKEILMAASLAKVNGCKINAITGFENTSLCKIADHYLIGSSKETSYRSDALSSRIVQLTYVDIIYVNLALKLGDKAYRSIARSRNAVANNKK